MKLVNVISAAFIGLAMLGYLYYGWLLLQTVVSGTSHWITIEFSILFILWLFPLVGIPILIILDRLREKKEQNNEVS